MIWRTLMQQINHHQTTNVYYQNQSMAFIETLFGQKIWDISVQNMKLNSNYPFYFVILSTYQLLMNVKIRGHLTNSKKNCKNTSSSWKSKLFVHATNVAKDKYMKKFLKVDVGQHFTFCVESICVILYNYTFRCVVNNKFNGVNKTCKSNINAKWSHVQQVKFGGKMNLFCGTSAS